MTSSSGCVDSALQILKKMQHDIDCLPPFEIDNLVLDLCVLRTFLKFMSIAWRNNTKGVPIHLRSLQVNVEVVAKEAQEQISVSCGKKYNQGMADSIQRLLFELEEKIEPLKIKMVEAYDFYLSIQPVHFVYYPMWDGSLWVDLIDSLRHNLIHLSCKTAKQNLLNLSRSVDALKGRLNYLMEFVMAASQMFGKNHEFSNCVRGEDEVRTCRDFWIHLGCIVVRTARLISLCGATELGEKMVEEMTISFFNIEKGMKPNSAEVMEMYFGVMKASISRSRDWETGRLVHPFVHFLLRGFQTLHENLVFLIEFLITTPKKNLEDVVLFCTDIKEVIWEAASLHGDELDEMERGKIGVENPLLLQLLKHIKLLVAEANLIQLLHSKHQFRVRDKDKYETLIKGIRLPKTFLRNLPEDCAENGKLILRQIEVVVHQARVLYLLCRDHRITDSVARNGLFKLFLKINLLKAGEFFMELKNTSLMVPFEDQIEILEEGLIFLRGLVTNQSDENEQDEKLVLAHIEEVTNRLISLYYSVQAAEITEVTVREMNILLPNLLEKINIIKAKLQEINSHIPWVSYPKTNGLGFLDFLLRNLRDLMTYEDGQIIALKHQLKMVLKDLEFLKSFLCAEKGVENPELKDLGRLIMNVAYEVGYVVDSIVVRQGNQWHLLSRFCYVLEEIRRIKMQVAQIHEKISLEVGVPSVVRSSRAMKMYSGIPQIDELVVCLHDQEEIIIDRLTRGSREREIVSVVGMSGIGKTTLASRVFNHQLVTSHFHIRAWCVVSQVYNKRDLLLDILRHFDKVSDNIIEMDDDDLGHELCKRLKGKTYLLVVDDIWDIKAWESLKESLPNDNNRSRILITTRLYDVALNAQPNRDPHPLRLLSDDESWKLLQIKLFRREGCPAELLELGLQISKNCEGLPLAVVAIAGLLERTDKKQDWWKNVAESLSSLIAHDPQTRCKEILELSYNHLPDYLKPCFLYLAALQKDKGIPVRKLTWLWIAEGFIQETVLESLEDVAEGYLKDLINRSLVIVTKRTSGEEVKTCHIHDMLRDLCLERCREDDFLELRGGYDHIFASSYDGLDYGIDPYYSHLSNSITYKEYRLFIHSKRQHFAMAMPAGPHVRSLLFFATSDMNPRCPYDISFISQKFRLLRVLDIECINMGNSFPGGIETLLHLRYLAVRGDIDFIPYSIAHLRNLETFLVTGLKGHITLSEGVWSLEKLRHLDVNSHACFTFQGETLNISSQLNTLVSLSCPCLSSGKNCEKILRRLSKLRKLRCIFVESRGEYCNQFPVLNSLTELESLKTSYYGRIFHPCHFDFPLNLRKLTLASFRLPWDNISEIGKLPNLEVLKLLSRAFEGKRWEMTEGEFLKLKFLKLGSLNISEWNASSDHLPKLRQLVLKNCKQLEEVPPGFGDIPTLQMIEMWLCKHSAEESVRRLKEEQLELGIEGLKVLINHSD